MDTAFGKNLRALRERKNLSQRELASKLNITNGTISLYENSGQYPQRREIIEGLQKILDCSEADLFGYADGYFNKQLTGFTVNDFNKININSATIKKNINKNLNKPLSEDLFYDIIEPNGNKKTATREMIIEDDSMNKIIPKGSTIVFTKTSDLEECTTHIICIEFKSQILIRRLFRVENTEYYILSPESTNNKYDIKQISPNDEYKLIGVAKSFTYAGKLL